MKIIVSLSLLALVTACGSSKSSDKAPTATTPVVSIDTNLDTITPSNPPAKPAQDQDIVIVKDPTAEEPKSETKPTETTKPVEEAAKPVPEAFVGFGYNTVESNVKELCLSGNVALDSSNSSTVVAFSRYENYEAFKTTALGFKSGSVLNKWAGSDFQEQFFTELKADSLKANYVFASSLISGTKRLSNSKLAIEALNPEAFHNKCGNKFISSAVVGGAFVASVSLQFANLEAKQNWEAERFDFTKLAELLQTEASYTAETRRVASVEIAYAQIGGGGALVPNLDGNDLLKCSIDSEESVKKCLKTLEKLGNYATSEAFVNSISKAPAVYSFTLSKY